MNLAFGHECEQFLIRNILSTLQRIAFSFDYSSKAFWRFTNALLIMMLSERKFKEERSYERCATLVGRAGQISLFTFRTAFRVVVQVLESLPLGGDCKARIYL